MNTLLIYILIPYLFVTPITFGGIIHSIVIKNNYLPKTKTPIDLGRKVFGKRIFGNNKTFRGFIIMITSGMLWGALLYLLGTNFDLDIVSRHYHSLKDSLLVGGVLGLIYLLGELPNSFFKRQFDIPAGHRKKDYEKIQYFIDQADSSFAVIIYLLVIGIEPIKVLSVFVTGTLIHVLFDKALHALKIKKLKTI